MTTKNEATNLLETEKTLLVVVEEHTLGFILPGRFNVCILHTSVLKGSYFNAFSSHIDYRYYTVRLATEQDFEEYRCVFNGYKNDDQYEYNKSDQPIYINIYNSKN